MRVGYRDTSSFKGPESGCYGKARSKGMWVICRRNVMKSECVRWECSRGLVINGAGQARPDVNFDKVLKMAKCAVKVAQ